MGTPNYGYWANRWLRAPAGLRKSPRYHLGDVINSGDGRMVKVETKCGIAIPGDPANEAQMFDACPTMSVWSEKAKTCDGSLHCKKCAAVLKIEHSSGGHRR
jgi:hypothetical protein